MRNIKLPLYIRAGIYVAVMFVALWCVWFFCYYHTILWREG